MRRRIDREKKEALFMTRHLATLLNLKHSDMQRVFGGWADLGMTYFAVSACKQSAKMLKRHGRGCIARRRRIVIFGFDPFVLCLFY
jgi:hypothetical protein